MNISIPYPEIQDIIRVHINGISEYAHTKLIGDNN